MHSLERSPFAELEAVAGACIEDVPKLGLAVLGQQALHRLDRGVGAEGGKSLDGCAQRREAPHLVGGAQQQRHSHEGKHGSESHHKPLVPHEEARAQAQEPREPALQLRREGEGKGYE